MGVVYKLKPEIVDFIVAYKKDHSSVSCRALGNLVREKFGVDVSKSSINVVIKDAQLSSPVGRRTVFSPHKIKPPQQIIKQDFSPVVDTMDGEGHSLGIGYLFLKAIEWDAQKGSILGLVLRDIGFNLPEKQLMALADIAMFFKLVSKEPASVFLHRKDVQWFLELIGGESDIDERELSDFISKIETSEEVSKKIENLCLELLPEAAKVRLFLKGGKSFCLDARLQSLFWDKESEEIDLLTPEAPLGRSCFEVGQQLLVADAPIVLNVFGGDHNICDFLEVLEGQGDREIIKIGIFDKNNNELLDFSFIPQVRRFFIVNVLLSQNMSQTLLEGKKFEKITEFFDEFLELRFNYTELSQADRVFSKFSRGLLRENFILNGDNVHSCILTNISHDIMSTMDIINKYIGKFPDFLKYKHCVHNDGKCKNPDENKYILSKKAKVLSNLEGLVVCLIEYFQPLLPVEKQNGGAIILVNNLLNLKGKIQLKPRYIKVILELKKDNPFETAIAFTIEKINKLNISDPSGRRVWFVIGKRYQQEKSLT